MILLLACAFLEPAPAPEPAKDLGFPHPTGFDQAAAHGADALAEDGPCLDCHQVEGSQAPRCESCHADYPHLEGWILDHGRFAEGCGACHAAAGTEAATSWACDRCHGAWPHAMTWALPSEHGAWFVARGAEDAACSSCHEAGTETACQGCHADYPHAENWSSPEVHGPEALADAESCAACHGADFGGGTTGVACSTCHASYPHGDELSDHVLAAEHGEGPCLRCHEAGDGPSTVQPGCARSCHGEAP